MKYDFLNPPSRKGTSCYKWDFFEGDMPMWVADMDFQTAPEVIEALKKRVEHGIYGYAITPPSWAKAYQDFYHDIYHWDFPTEAVVFSLGVVPILSSSVRALTKVGDNVVIMPPVYNIFYNSIRNNGRNIYEVPLKENGDRYDFDYEGLEKAFALESTSLCILCNPGNPTARIWEKEELLALGKLAKKYNVIILSDEIHGPLTRPGKLYVPFLSVDPSFEEFSFTALSPTKAFNLAGIHTAALIAPNKELRAKVERQLNTDEVAEPNVFSCVASTTAFNQGRQWLEELREVLFTNRDIATKYINENIPLLRAYPGDATYLLWVDCGLLEQDSKKLLDYLSKEDGLIFNDGNSYGQGGEHHFRINLACPTAQLEKALKRLHEAVNKYGQI